MLSVDANLLLYAVNTASPHHRPALEFMRGLGSRTDIAISEFILVEFYVLLRNPAVLVNPLDEVEAAALVQTFRRHPRWMLLGFDPDSRALHDELWRWAGQQPFARRRIIDSRTALTLVRQGVTEFATANLKDFQDCGFKRVWNPLSDPAAT
jgi:toxin-antitoxin system PIN domain toxin